MRHAKLKGPTKTYACMCHGKHGYLTPERAQEAIIGYHGGNAAKFKIYFCPFCHQWHMSRKRK